MTSLIKYPSIAAAVLSLLINTSSGAFAQAEHEQHHPQGGAAANPQAEPTPTDKAAGPSSMSKGGMMGGMMQGGGMMGMRGTAMMEAIESCPLIGPEDDQTRIKGRVAFIKAELAISDSQKDVWEAYSKALEKNLEGIPSLRQSMVKVMEAKTPAERLERRIAAMESRVAALKDMKAPLSNLYTALSDEQKRTADHILSLMGCMM